MKPYIPAGAGLYYRAGRSVAPPTSPPSSTIPFLGFCYPALGTANQVIASFSTYKAGFNAGEGIEYRIGDHHWKIFSEARYTSSGPDLTFVPVTFGVRW